jgi:hypothetical protein
MVRRSLQLIALIVILQLTSCDFRRELKQSLPSTSVASSKIFNSKMLNKWYEATRKSVTFQERSCDSLQVHPLLENFLARFNISENGAGNRNTHRTSFLGYLHDSGVMPDTIEYNSIYIAESSTSGESAYLFNTLAIVKDQKAKLYKFEYVLGDWKLVSKWDAESDKIEYLFPKLSCAGSKCDTATMGSNESLIVSRIASGGIESRVIVLTCEEYLWELNDLFKLELLGF